MELCEVARTVTEDMARFVGPEDRYKVTELLAHRLASYVYEVLDHPDYKVSDEVYKAVQFIAARAMMAQYEYDAELVRKRGHLGAAGQVNIPTRAHTGDDSP